MSELIQFAVGFLVVGGFTMLYLLYRLKSAHKKLIVRVRRRYADLRGKVSFFQQRLTVIQTYGADYMNSMSPEGVRAMYQLQQLILTQTRLVDELKASAESDDTVSLAEADKVLVELLYSPDRSSPPSESGVVRSKFDRWEIRFEGLLQLAGRDIAIASRAARDLGVPRRRDRQPTHTSLKAAGIIAAEQDGE